MSAETTALTERSPPKVLLFGVVTLGLYWLYYLHRLNRELKTATGAGYSPVVRTVLLVIPPVNLYAVWQMGQSAGEATDEVSPVVGAVGMLFPFLGAFLVQPKLDRLA
jgi:hypothetical protein